jgi:hypothetical protein
MLTHLSCGCRSNGDRSGILGCRREFVLVILGPRLPGNHPKIVSQHGPSDLQATVFQTLGSGDPIEKVVLQYPDAAFGLAPAALGCGKDFVVFEPTLKPIFYTLKKWSIDNQRVMTTKKSLALHSPTG